MTQATERQAAVSKFIELAKNQTRGEVTRERLDVVLKALMGLAARRDWWAEADYAAPTGDALQNRYLIHDEPDGTYSLYLNVMRPGKKIVPHNHTTWACIAGVEGVETNYLYARTDGGVRAGHATLKKTGEKKVGPGTGIALLADDIHAVHIEDPAGIRHLHMYGLALEKLTERLAYDVQNNTCKVMDVGVKTRRGAN